ncbi:hypothetical protein [Haloferula sp. BvORR071]|uniref:hypothetical protein n=1 Tax=Haloferula sp. BvORR071 TaxID=1396141 RepID=UPI00055156F5|nr:hypothetical protein [Haloferula sp. BvORR071]
MVSRPGAAKYIAAWDEQTRGLKGDSLKAAQWRLAKEAIEEGLGGMDMAAFLEHVQGKTGSDLQQWLVSHASSCLYHSVDREQAKEWILALENPRFQTDLLFFMGTDYDETDGPEAFLKRISLPAAREAFLSGYCVNLAHEKPEEAVKTFLRWNEPGKDIGALGRVVGILPEFADFDGIAESLHALSDAKGVGPVSETLLRRWASLDPGRAAEYAVSNPGTVLPDHLGSVVGVWLQSSPAEAASWVTGLAPSPFKTSACGVMVAGLLEGDPAQAWTYALQMEDAGARDAAIETVHTAWAKLDSVAADSALAQVKRRTSDEH